VSVFLHFLSEIREWKGYTGIMNKSEAVAQFKSEILPAMKKGDKPAVREAWNNWTDALHKDRQITDKQYRTWTNPW
jgi:ABC-type amino acid transport substrate-binding protein